MCRSGENALSEDVIIVDANGENLEQQDSETSAIHDLAEKENADVFVVSGHIDYILADHLIDIIGDIEQQKPKAVVFLCTFGGDADAAYIIARTLQKEYTHTTLYIYGFCKSAGTLIALGANKIVMGSKGELGPLDVQLRTEDSFSFTFTSGLGSAKSIEYLQSKASDSFWDSFTKLTKASEKSITAQTTANIAKDLVVGLLAPIAAQIDPLRLAENQRALDVAKNYGLRLAAEGSRASVKSIDQLVYGYPSHHQVIDLDEAQEVLGDCVRPFSELEKVVALEAMLYMMKERGRESIRFPIGVKFRENAVAHLNPVRATNEPETVVSNDLIEDHPEEKGNDEEEVNNEGNGDAKAAT